MSRVGRWTLGVLAVGQCVVALYMADTFWSSDAALRAMAVILFGMGLANIFRALDRSAP